MATALRVNMLWAIASRSVVRNAHARFLSSAWSAGIYVARARTVEYATLLREARRRRAYATTPIGSFYKPPMPVKQSIAEYKLPTHSLCTGDIRSLQTTYVSKRSSLALYKLQHFGQRAEAVRGTDGVHLVALGTLIGTNCLV